jgi:hypothetical protein
MSTVTAKTIQEKRELLRGKLQETTLALKELGQTVLQFAQEQATTQVSQVQKRLKEWEGKGGEIVKARLSASLARWNEWEGKAIAQVEAFLSRVKPEVEKKFPLFLPVLSRVEEGVRVVDSRWKDLLKKSSVGNTLPIPDYDTKSVPEVVQALKNLSREDLLKVKEYEEKNKGRKGILREIDALLEPSSPSPQGKVN